MLLYDKYCFCLIRWISFIQKEIRWISKKHMAMVMVMPINSRISCPMSLLGFPFYSRIIVFYFFSLITHLIFGHAFGLEWQTKTKLSFTTSLGDWLVWPLTLAHLRFKKGVVFHRMVGNKQYPFFYMTVSPTSVGSTFLMKGMLYVTVIQICK